MKRSRVLAASGVVAAATVLLTAVPASANTVSGGSVSCGPDQVVQISWSQNKAGYDSYGINAAPSGSFSAPKGADWITTGRRSISSWAVKSLTSGVVLSHGSAGCVDRPAS